MKKIFKDALADEQLNFMLSSKATIFVLVMPLMFFIFFIQSIIYTINSNSMFGYLSFLSIFLLLIVVIKYKKLNPFKYFVKKIVVDGNNIVVCYPFGRDQFSIDDVISIGSKSFMIYRAIGVLRTKSSDVYFPLTMKDVDEQYPKLDSRSGVWKWIDSENNLYDIGLSNCPLYHELNKQISPPKKTEHR